MRLFLLSTVSSAALIALAVPAFAGDNMTGVAKASVGIGSASGNFLLDDPMVYSLSGRGYWTLSPDVHLQADLFYQRADSLVLDDPSIFIDTNSSMIGGALHLLHPLENRARVGFAGSIWNTDVLPFEVKKTDRTYGLAAFEGQFFGTDWTVTGQAGFVSSFDDGDLGGEGGSAIDSGTFARGKVRYFLYDNTALSIETTQLWGKLTSNSSAFEGKSLTSTQWNFDLEHKFDDSPLSGVIGFEQQHEDSIVFGGGSDVTTVTLGVKFYLDQPTLKSNDRSGAELDTPTFGNVTPATSAVAVGNAF